MKHRSVSHTITPDGYISPGERTTRAQILLFTPFQQWLTYIITGK
jgi:hypothetical protein